MVFPHSGFCFSIFLSNSNDLGVITWGGKVKIKGTSKYKKDAPVIIRESVMGSGYKNKDSLNDVFMVFFA